MRDMFEDAFRNQPLDPVESARRGLRAPKRRRFYKDVSLAEGEGGFALTLDGKPVKTPARNALAVPAQKLAQALAAEWRAQGEHIDPAAMPLTRIANSIIDGVAVAPTPVAADVAKYLASDLLFYRAATPAGLAARQQQAWDPLLAWTREALGARFVLAEGIAFVAQPEAALAAARAAIPADPWRLGALHVMTTLTGSALIALALLHGRLTPEAAWAAAHVDEDWNLERWGSDEAVLAQRAARFAEFSAAHLVIQAV